MWSCRSLSRSLQKWLVSMLYCGYLPRLSMLYCKCDFFSILFVQSTSLVAMFYWFCFLMSMLYCNVDLVVVFPVLANVLVAMLYFGCLLRLSMLYCRFFFVFNFFLQVHFTGFNVVFVLFADANVVLLFLFCGSLSCLLLIDS